MGRRHPLKGIEYLEEAVRQLQNNSASLPLCVKIVSNAFGKEKERIWEWCDCLVLPTLSENFGLVVAEALERAKRVITTDGAPALEPKECEIVKVLPISNTNSQLKQEIIECLSGRMLYLRGYREGTAEERVALLKCAIQPLITSHYIHNEANSHFRLLQ